MNWCEATCTRGPVAMSLPASQTLDASSVKLLQEALEDEGPRLHVVAAARNRAKFCKRAPALAFVSPTLSTARLRSSPVAIPARKRRYDSKHCTATDCLYESARIRTHPAHICHRTAARRVLGAVTVRRGQYQHAQHMRGKIGTFLSPWVSSAVSWWLTGSSKLTTLRDQVAAVHSVLQHVCPGGVVLSDVHK